MVAIAGAIVVVENCVNCEFARWIREQLGEDLSHSRWSDAEVAMGARRAHFIGTQSASPFCQVYHNEIRWARLARESRRRTNLAYVAHPVRGAFAANVRRAREWVNWLNEVSAADRAGLAAHPGLVFVAPWLATASRELDEAGGTRGRFLALCARAAAACDEIWLVGAAPPSDGMLQEMGACVAAGGIAVRVALDRPPADPADLRRHVSRAWVEHRT